MRVDDTLSKIRSHISNGGVIKWVGYHSARNVWVHLSLNGVIVKEMVHLQEDYTDDTFREIKSSGADRPGTNTGTIWASNSRLELLRLASILGINVGGSCKLGPGQEFVGLTQCMMAYDIETDRSRIPLSSFGTLSESITSIATFCSCGEKMLFSFIPDVDFDYVLCKDSPDTVSKFLDYVKLHSPQWLLGYNNFSYDNTRISYHAPARYDDILIPMRVGSGSSLTYAFYIDVEGVYNIDLMAYLDKTRRSMYTDMKLATLAKHHDAGIKMDFDTAEVTDYAKFFEYNIHDTRITLELAIKSQTVMEIGYLCNVACVPVIDAARFVSGTFGPCAIASYCLDKKISMDWSPCTNFQEYRGAEVLKPVIGTHENVVSCDFSSMYPSVLLGANISIENFIVTRTTQKEGSTWVSSSGTNFVVNNRRIGFKSEGDVVVPPVMRLLVDKRKMVRKTNPALAGALKTTANSIYGSIGDKNSKIYSPNCSACVTTGGRWCLSVAETILKVYGYAVVYGDTDSCFVASSSKSKGSIDSIMNIMSRIFDHTSFPGMSMEVDNKYSKISFFGKKTYFGRKTDGTIISKGMSKSRKDRIGVCRSLASHTVQIILEPNINIYTRQEIIGNMISSVIDLSITSRLTLGDVSKIIKKGGTSYYEFVSRSGKRRTVECESTTGLEVVDYSAGEITRLVAREMKLLLRITNIGSVSYVIQQSSII